MPHDPFVDLEIRIQQTQAEGYPIEITLAGQQEFPRGFFASDLLPWFPSGDLVADGQRLFSALLADVKVREAWAQARGQAPQRRIRLRIDPAAAELHALPWELLHDGSNLLSAHADTPFSRYLPIALPWGGGIDQRPIKVLIVIANPDDLQNKYDLLPIDVALEEEILEAAFSPIDPQALQIDFLDAPITLERLEAKLREGYHLLHFLGHGAFNARRGQAALYLQAEDGHARRVIDAELAGMLARQGVQPQLIFFAVCQSATRSSADAYLGLGPKLVAAGVPAVVAMQDMVTVKSARQFSATFYQCLIEHGQADRAVNEARSTLITSGRPDAAVPVLFMRVKSGHLWREEPASAESRSSELMFPAPPEPARPPDQPHFVGRASELAYFSQALDEQHLVVIAGMHGAGKTALASTLVARQTQSRVFWHTVHENEGVVAVVWQLAGFLAYHGQAELWQMLQRAQQTGGPPPPATVLLDYLATLLPGHAYVLCFDDLHFVYADPLLTPFFQRLQPALQAGSLALVIAAETAPPFVQVDAYPPLAGLSLPDAQGLLAQHGLASAADELDHERVHATQSLLLMRNLPGSEIVVNLYARTGGNPLLLTLAADGLKRATNPARFLTQLFNDSDIERFLIKEIDRKLSAAERNVLIALAVLLGYPATRDAIEAVLDGENVRQALSELAQRHLLTVTEGEQGRTYAAQVLVRAFYYDFISRSQRREMHGRAAQYYAIEETDALRAALHYQRAGEYNRSAEQLTMQLWALIGQGHVPIVRQLLEAFTAEQLDAAQWSEVNFACGEVYTLIGERQRAQVSYEAAYALATTSMLRGKVCRGMGNLLRSAAPREALTWLQRGVSELAEERELQADLLIKLSTVQIYLDEYGAARDSVQAGLALLPAADSAIRLGALMNLGVIYSRLGDSAQAIVYHEQALVLGEELNSHFTLIGVWNNLGKDRRRSGDWPGAMAAYQAGLDLARQLGVVSHQIVIGLNLAYLQILRGEIEAAIALLQHNLSLAQTENLKRFELLIQINLAEVALLSDQRDDAEARLNEADRIARAIENQDQLIEIDQRRARLCLLCDDVAAAQSWAQRAVEIADRLGMTLEKGVSLRVLGEVLLAADECDAALAALEQSAALTVSDPYEAACVQRAWSRALRAANPDRAEELLRAARSTFERLGAQWNAANLV